MADWYASSAAYTAIAAFVPSVAYSVGQIVKPTAPTVNNQYAYRCTTAGTAGTEPNWAAVANADGSTVTTGGATFTNVTGRSTYFWAAVAGDMGSITGDGSGACRLAIGDRLFISSDHSESAASRSYFGNFPNGWPGPTTFMISVNRAGSTPPVAADIASGATFIASSGQLTLEFPFPLYLQGLSFQSAASISFNSGNYHGSYLKNCALWLNNVSAGSRIVANNPHKTTWDNTTVRFGAVGQCIVPNYIFDLTWINTPAAMQGATVPTALFAGQANSGGPLLATCRGVDLSAVTSALMVYAHSGAKVLLDSCKIASGVTRYNSSGAQTGQDILELVNCYDGTRIVNERYVAAGSVVTERTITLVGGATDDVGTFSHKMASASSLLDRWAMPLDGFWFDVENMLIGSSHTATVEIVSSASLNNDDISLLLQYQGTASSSFASFAWSLPTTPVTASAAVTSSAAAWNSLPATPVTQKLQVTFTPQVAGRVRGQVRLGKASTTVYVNPQVTIT